MMLEEAFIGQFQQQRALCITALPQGKAAETLGQVKKLNEQDVDPTVGRECASLWQNIKRRFLLFKISSGLPFFSNILTSSAPK